MRHVTSCASASARETGPRVLAIVAHPDDESTFAGALYKLAHFHGAACDEAVITDGEGGFKYSTLAEPIYGVELTDEAVGRAELPAIRERELADAAAILGVRDLYFFGERDHRYTTDVGEVLGPGAATWRLARVRAELKSLLANGRYDYVFTLLPTPETHAHHQAATLLALEAVARLPRAERPIILAARVGARGDLTRPQLVSGFELAVLDAREPFVFDRETKFGHRDALDYRVIVNWEIAAHKSQGTMQLAMNHGEVEQFFLFADEPSGAVDRCTALFAELARVSFAHRVYGESAGTNAKP